MGSLRRHQRGSALLLVVVILIAILGISSAFFMLVMHESNTQHSMNMGNDARYVTEAAVARAVEELRSGVDYDGNGIVGSTLGTFNNAPYEVALSDPGDGTLLLYAGASQNEVRRAAEVRLTVAPNVPAPGFGAQAALSILGQLGKKGKIALHLKKPHDHDDHFDGDGDAADDDEAENWNSTSTSPVAIDGFDASGTGANLPAIGIEDATTYDRVTKRIAEEIAKGKLPEDAIIGDPMVPLFDKHGNQVEASVVPLQRNPTSLNYENLNVVHDQIALYVQNDLIPAADITITNDITTSVTYGSAVDPKVVVLDVNKAEVRPGVTLNGTGTLIVNGDLSIMKDAVFNWNGEVIVNGGGSKDAVFRNKHGELTIDGMVLVLAGDGQKKAKLELHNDKGTHEGSTVINGAVLVWSGNASKHQEKAEFKAKHGDFLINGFIGVYGDKTKFDAKIDHHHHHEEHHHHRHPDGSFVVQGGVVVAVPGNDEKHKAKVHLHGDDILIKYDKVKIEEALDALINFGRKMPDSAITATYEIVSWREIPFPNELMDGDPSTIPAGQ